MLKLQQCGEGGKPSGPTGMHLSHTLAPCTSVYTAYAPGSCTLRSCGMVLDTSAHLLMCPPQRLSQVVLLCSVERWRTIHQSFLWQVTSSYGICALARRWPGTHHSMRWSGACSAPCSGEDRQALHIRCTAAAPHSTQAFKNPGTCMGMHHLCPRDGG